MRNPIELTKELRYLEGKRRRGELTRRERVRLDSLKGHLQGLFAKRKREEGASDRTVVKPGRGDHGPDLPPTGDPPPEWQETLAATRRKAPAWLKEELRSQDSLPGFEEGAEPVGSTDQERLRQASDEAPDLEGGDSAELPTGWSKSFDGWVSPPVEAGAPTGGVPAAPRRRRE